MTGIRKVIYKIRMKSVGGSNDGGRLSGDKKGQDSDS